jgi:4-hydroxy-3-polyprenylbenzoate decarboxylase
LQEPDRKGWFFDNVVDVTGRKYDIPVALAVMAPNRLVYALGMGVNSAAEISPKWAYAQTHTIPPRTLSSGPCQELIYEGQALRDAGGAGMLPVPISTPGFDSAPFLSSGHWVTKDPETGDLNFGTYRGQIKSPTRIGLFAFAYQDVSAHWNKAHALGKPLEAAIVIGCTPNLSYCSTSRAEATSPVNRRTGEVVRCKTDRCAGSQRDRHHIILTDELARILFGEFTATYPPEPHKFMNVTASRARQRLNRPFSARLQRE